MSLRAGPSLLGDTKGAGWTGLGKGDHGLGALQSSAVLHGAKEHAEAAWPCGCCCSAVGAEHRSVQGDHIRVKFVVLLIMNVSSFLINSLLNVRSLS